MVVVVGTDAAVGCGPRISADLLPMVSKFLLCHQVGNDHVDRDVPVSSLRSHRQGMVSYTLIFYYHLFLNSLQASRKILQFLDFPNRCRITRCCFWRQMGSYETVVKRWPIILTTIIDNIYQYNHKLATSTPDGPIVNEERIAEGTEIIKWVRQVKYDMEHDRPDRPKPL